MSSLTIKEALNLTSKISSPKEATMLLSHILKRDNIYLILNEKRELSKKEKREFFEALEKLKKSIPIEYILQKVSFYSREFFIREGALIPRPETEILIDKVLEVAKEFKNPKIAEIGIGSGVISIMLSLFLKEVSIVATDISKEAIEIAKENIKRFNIKKIFLYNSSYLDNINQKFDIIVSNPPYVANDFKVEKKLYFEPKEAIFGGEVGDEVLKEIIDLSFKKRVKYLICEIGYDQKERILNYLRDKSYQKVEFYKDLSSFDRGFILKI